PRRSPRGSWRRRPCYSWSCSCTAKLTRTRTRQAVTPPSSTTAVMRSTSTSGLMPFNVAKARATARPTASSMEFVDVPVSSIVFPTRARVLPRRRVGLDRRAEARYTRLMGGVMAGMEWTTLGVGCGVGLVIGVLAGWLAVGLRARETRARLETELAGGRRVGAGAGGGPEAGGGGAPAGV